MGTMVERMEEYQENLKLYGDCDCPIEKLPAAKDYLERIGAHFVSMMTAEIREWENGYRNTIVRIRFDTKKRKVSVSLKRQLKTLRK